MGKPWEKYPSVPQPPPTPAQSAGPWAKYGRASQTNPMEEIGALAQQEYAQAGSPALPPSATINPAPTQDPLMPKGGWTPEQQAQQQVRNSDPNDPFRVGGARPPAPVAAPQPQNWNDQIASWISDNVTPLAQKAGESVGGMVLGQRPGGEAVAEIGKGVGGGLSEWGATTFRDPVEGANQAVEMLEPTHLVAEGYNELKNSLASVFEGDWESAQKHYSAATIPLLSGTAGVLPGGSMIVGGLQKAATRAPGATVASQLFKPGPTPVDRAADILIKKMKADGLTLEDLQKVQRSLANRGDSGVYETFSELGGLAENSSGANLRGLAMALGSVPGPAQEAILARVAQNAEQLPKRTSRAASRATGQDASKAAATLDELEKRLKTESGPLYQKFYDAPVEQQIYDAQIAPVLNAPHGQAAMERAARGLGVEAASLQASAASGAGQATPALQRTYEAAMALKNALDGKATGPLPPLALDHVKRAFDDLIDEAGQGTYTGGNLRSAKRNFAESVSRATGGTYGDALGFYEGGKRLEEAFDIGLNALKQPTWQLERAMNKGNRGSPFSAGEVEAIAMGVARHIEDLIETNDQAALTKLLKGKALKNLSTALGDPKAAAKFEQSIQRLAANREWGRRVSGGSDTAMRTAAIDDASRLEEDPITRALDRAANSSAPPSIFGAAWQAVAKPAATAATDAYRRLKYPGIRDEAVNAALAPMMGNAMTKGNLDQVTATIEARLAAKNPKRLPPPPPSGGPPPVSGPKSPPRLPAAQSASPPSPPVKAGFGGSKPLDMSEAARMQRAREQGFDVDTPLYHGTAADFEAFDPRFRGLNDKNADDAPLAFFFSTSPDIAGQYAGEAARVAARRNYYYKSGVHTPSPGDKDAWKYLDEQSQNGASTIPAYARLRNPKIVTEVSEYDTSVITPIIEAAKAAGHDGVIFKGMNDALRRGARPGDVYAIFDPSSVRGKFAAFDPAEAGSSKLLAGMGAAPEGIGATAGATAGYALNPTDANGDGVIDDKDRGLNAMAGLISGGVGVKGARMGAGAAGNAMRALTKAPEIPPLTLPKENRVFAPGQPDDLGFITSAEYVLANPIARFKDAKNLTLEQWRKFMREGGASSEAFQFQIEPALKRLADEGYTGDIPKAKLEEALARTRGTLTKPPEKRSVERSAGSTTGRPGSKFETPTEADYSQYVAPGSSSNYKQHVLLLPKEQGAGYKSHNWKSENPVGHIRTTNRTSANGEKVLHVEELQSDLHQEGAKNGYKGEPGVNIQSSESVRANAKQKAARTVRKYEEWRDKFGSPKDPLGTQVGYEDALTADVIDLIKDPTGREFWREAVEAQRRAEEISRGWNLKQPPRAPMENWEEPFIRYALKQGADQGVDVITFPTSKTLHHALQNEGTGKFYDGRLPRHLESVAKSLGLRVEEIEVPIANKSAGHYRAGARGDKFNIANEKSGEWYFDGGEFDTLREAQDAASRLNKKTSVVPAIRLTPQAKARLSEGVIMDAKDPGRRPPPKPANAMKPAQAGFGFGGGRKPPTEPPASVGTPAVRKPITITSGKDDKGKGYTITAEAYNDRGRMVLSPEWPTNAFEEMDKARRTAAMDAAFPPKPGPKLVDENYGKPPKPRPEWEVENPKAAVDIQKQVAQRFVGLMNADPSPAHVLALREGLDIQAIGDTIESGLPQNKQIWIAKDGGEIAVVDKTWHRQNPNEYPTELWSRMWPSSVTREGRRYGWKDGRPFIYAGQPKPTQAGFGFGGKGPPAKPRPVESRREAPRGTKPFSDPRLSPGENKTAEMVFNGYSYDEIADEMMTSVDVVKRQAMLAQRKLGDDVKLPRPGMGRRPPGTTKREAINEMFAGGLDNLTIAQRAGVPIGTVRTYRSYWKQSASGVPVANVNGASYNPPKLPPRPFEADYPQKDWPDGPPVDAQGRLLFDMEGRPLNQNATIVGRSKAPGVGPQSEADRPLRDKTATIQTLRNTGSEFGRTPRESLPGQTDGYWNPSYADNGRFTGRGSAVIADDLDRQVAGLDDQELMTIAHELGHSIDFKTNPARTVADSDARKWGINHRSSTYTRESQAKIEGQLQRIYRDLNNAPDGPAQINSPLDRGYKATDEARELWAEAIRAYIWDPNYIKTVAPDVAFLIRNHVNKNSSLRKTIQFNSAPIVGVGGAGLAGALAASGQNDRR